MRALLFENALKNDYTGDSRMGFSVEIHNGYYRNYALSCIEKIALWIDGEKIAEDDIQFVYQGKIYRLTQLQDQYMEYWEVMEPAFLKVMKKGGLPKGKHLVKVELRIRVAYVPMPFTPETKTKEHSYWVPVYVDEKEYTC